MNTHVDFDTGIALRNHGLEKPLGSEGPSIFHTVSRKWVYRPTSNDILDQFPGATLGNKNGEWVCRFLITDMQPDFRTGACPHQTVADAFIAWKKGLE